MLKLETEKLLWTSVLHTHPASLLLLSDIKRPPYINKGSPEKQNQQDEYVRVDLLQGLAHVITEAEKFHHLPYASQKSRKAGGVIQPGSEAWLLQVQKMDVSAQAERVNLPFLHLLFYAGPQGIG